MQVDVETWITLLAHCIYGGEELLKQGFLIFRLLARVQFHFLQNFMYGVEELPRQGFLIFRLLARVQFHTTQIQFHFLQMLGDVFAG